jgi:hypothetical protein
MRPAIECERGRPESMTLADFKGAIRVRRVYWRLRVKQEAFLGSKRRPDAR